MLFIGEWEGHSCGDQIQAQSGYPPGLPAFLKHQHHSIRGIGTLHSLILSIFQLHITVKSLTVSS